MKLHSLSGLALAFAIATAAYAGSGSVNVTTSPTQVLSASSSRTWYVLQNNSSNDVYFKLDSSTNTLTATNGIKLPAGGSVTVAATQANMARNAVWAISSTGTSAVTFQEGSER